MCIQCLLKINYTCQYLPIADLGKLSDWSFDRSNCFSFCLFGVIILAIFGNVVLNVFNLRRVFFYGDSALIADSS